MFCRRSSREQVMKRMFCRNAVLGYVRKRPFCRNATREYVMKRMFSCSTARGYVRKRIFTAIRIQAAATQGLLRSPMRAIFQNVPSSLSQRYVII